MFRALLQKNFPEDVRLLFQYDGEVESPPKAYIFTIPQEGTVFDYKYIKEVFLNNRCVFNAINMIFCFRRVKVNGSYGRMKLLVHPYLEIFQLIKLLLLLWKQLEIWLL